MPDIVYNYKNNLYLNITNRCPNNCEFCDIEKIGNDLGVDLILKEEPSSDQIITKLANKLSLKVQEVVFCGGGEPLLRLDTILQIIGYIKAEYTTQVRLDTCGYPAAFYKDRKVAQELKQKGLDSVSISVNSLDQEQYNKICKPNIESAFAQTIEFVKECKAVGIKTRITFVDYNIDRKECKKFADQLDVDCYIRSYSPV